MKIDVTLNDTKEIVSNSKIIGKENENKATTLVFHITDRIAKLNFYLDIELPDGSKFRTSKLDPIDNIIEYVVPNTILNKNGFLGCEVILQDNDDYVEKYPRLNFKIENSINAIEDLPGENPTLAAEIQKVIELVEQTGDGTKFLSDDGTYKSVSGGAIKEIESLDMNSPIILRDLDSGCYCLHGYILPFSGSDALFAAQTPIQVNVAKSSEISFVQLFFAFNNQLQYFEITDSNYTMQNIVFGEILTRLEALESKVS